MAAARLGVMRLNAARLDVHQPWVKVVINGVDRTANVKLEQVMVTDVEGEEPNTAALRVKGFVPTKGHEILIHLGDTDLVHRLFAGHILSVDKVYESKDTILAYDLACIDYTFLLNRRKVIKRYVGQSATAIILDLLASFTSGFTTTGVATGMPVLDEITFTNEDVTTAISRVMTRVGGYWFVDYARVVHAFVSSDAAAGSITDAQKRGARDLRESEDLSQVITRVWSRGGGSVALVAAAPGATTLPIEDASWYSSGRAEVGQQRLTYTGVAGTSQAGAVTGFVQPPSAANLSFAAGNGAIEGTDLTPGLYWIGAANVTAEGETEIGALTQVTIEAIHNEVFISKVAAPTDAKVTGLRFYIGTNGGGQDTLKAWSGGSAAGEPTTYSWTLNWWEVKAANTANRAPLATGTAGVSAIPTAAGATAILVNDLAPFPASGWADVGGQVFRYTGRSASSGSGTLTGIPTSGVGSLTAPVRAGTVRVIPHLTGIPASGEGSILYEIGPGDEVLVLAMVEDTTAQSVMAGLVGGDGIHEDHIQDGRLSLTEATNRGQARLTQQKDPHKTVSFATRDPSCRSGRSIAIAVSAPAVNGTFRIQRVTITEIGVDGGHAKAHIFPRRQVEASSRRYSFEDLLRQIRGS